jgi:phage tail-like protein
MTGEIPNVHYAVLRDGARWEQVKLTGLEVAPEGALQLMRVPASPESEPIDLPGPFAVDSSGIAVGRCGDLFIADTAGHRVVWRDGVCGARMVLPSHGGAGSAPGHFDEPRGLLLGPAGLYVTDSGNARVQVFRLPTLEPRAIWTGPFQTPAGLAADSLGRIYVLDRGLQRVLRFDSWGTADAAFNTTLAAELAGASPTFLTVDDKHRLYLSDTALPGIRCFDENGSALDVLLRPNDTAAFQAGALAAHAERLYAADAGSGFIWLYDLATRQWAGVLPGWRGPVTAMAVDEQGTLYLKPGAGDLSYMLAANTGCVASGQLVTERLDAGEISGWFRVRVDAGAVPGTSVDLQTFVTDDETITSPAEADWSSAAALDLLLPQTVVPEMSEPQLRRFLWLRIRMKSENGRANPRLLQAQAETPGEDYIDHLPAVYRRKDTGFLRRWLAAYRAELGDLELVLEDMPRHFNAATVPAGELSWLAAWLAFELPPGSIEQSRERLQRALDLYRKRGTPSGVREQVELSSGVRPILVESFRGRRIWQLGESSRLGCDTALAPLAPHGMVLPDPTLLGNPKCDPSQPSACSTDRMVVGSTVVGASGPLAATDLGEPLFSETAHHFSAFVFLGRVQKPARREALRRALENERPAHTNYDLCIVEPRMRVGLQSSIGLDSYVAGPPEPMALTGSVLGLNSYLGEEPGERGASRVGQRALLGSETILE